MFEKEEEKLKDYHEKIKKLPVDDLALQKAIQQGVQQAKMTNSRTRRKRNWLFTVASIAVVMILFVTSIRISPTFANAVSRIPGMGKIVEMIEYDKGMQSILDNEYYEELNESITVDHMKLTLTGAILDETGLVVFYTLEAPFDVTDLWFNDIAILHNGKKINAGIAFNDPDQQYAKIKDDYATFLFEEQQRFDVQDFTLQLKVANEEETEFNLPFTLRKAAGKGKVYPLNETVTIDQQKITVESVEIHPLRVKVSLNYDEINTMKILQIENIKLIDENGETWSKIQNGVSGRILDGQAEDYYLQSNYFKQPEKLFLELSQIQALEKDAPQLIIDPWKKKVVQQPNDQILDITNVESGFVEGRFKVEDDFSYATFSSITNEDGSEVELLSELSYSHDEEGYAYFTVTFNEADVKGPLHFEFFAYPNYLKGKETIEIK